MARFVFDKKAMEWVPAGEYYARQPPKPRTPMIIGDIRPYRAISTSDRPVIGGRAAEREYMRRNDLVHYEDGVQSIPDKVLDSPAGLEQDVADAYAQLESK